LILEWVWIPTGGSAAGGFIVSETLHYAAKKQSEKAYATDNDKGKSDAVKAGLGVKK
jgi:hypothetical protein